MRTSRFSSEDSRSSVCPSDSSTQNKKTGTAFPRPEVAGPTVLRDS
jgi:hypothetical protein